MTPKRLFLRTVLLIILSVIALISHASEEIAENDGTSVVSHFNPPAIEAGSGSFLFVTTVPFGARIFLDDVLIEGRTPLMLRVPDAGERNLRIEMSGFDSLEEHVTIGVDKVIVVEGALNPTGVSLFLPSGTIVGTNGEVLPPGGYSFSRGYYDLYSSEGSGTLAPVYPHQKWIDSLNISIPVVSVFAGGLVISEVMYPRSESNISPFTIGVMVTDLLMIGANIGLHVHRSGWRKEWELDSVEAAPLNSEDDYRLAEDALATGDWELARNLFDRYSLVYPLDERSPKALYRSARLTFLQDDIIGCVQRLDRLKTEYPVPEYWDRIWRLSAEAAFREGHLDDGLYALDMIFGIDASVDLESVALKKATVLSEEYERNGESGPALEAWSELIEDWPDSAFIEEYRNQRNSLGQSISE